MCRHPHPAGQLRTRLPLEVLGNRRGGGLAHDRGSGGGRRHAARVGGARRDRQLRCDLWPGQGVWGGEAGGEPAARGHSMAPTGARKAARPSGGRPAPNEPTNRRRRSAPPAAFLPTPQALTASSSLIISSSRSSSSSLRSMASVLSPLPGAGEPGQRGGRRRRLVGRRARSACVGGQRLQVLPWVQRSTPPPRPPAQRRQRDSRGRGRTWRRSQTARRPPPPRRAAWRASPAGCARPPRGGRAPAAPSP